jgi:urocanate hydratase
MAGVAERRDLDCAGDAFRGATWVSLHNGGGVGWGEVVNGGFGLVSCSTFSFRRKTLTEHKI